MSESSSYPNDSSGDFEHLALELKVHGEIIGVRRGVGVIRIQGGRYIVEDSVGVGEDDRVVAGADNDIADAREGEEHKCVGEVVGESPAG